uniref:Uncharacterized protein n=1 Tax=Cacopsylla melanoneura TaxID=428564 RepID=A0A8D8X606_9HEMI
MLKQKVKLGGRCENNNKAEKNKLKKWGECLKINLEHLEGGREKDKKQESLKIDLVMGTLGGRKNDKKKESLKIDLVMETHERRKEIRQELFPDKRNLVKEQQPR